MPRFRAAVIALALTAVLFGCNSEPSSDLPDLTDPTVPESWVAPQWSPSYWFVLADVREFVGEVRWAALDTAWMEEKARADLARFGPKNQNPSEHMYSGLWRLGLLREEVMAAIAEQDGEAGWPLDTPGNRLQYAWRPRFARWVRAQGDDLSITALGARLGASWKAAKKAGDPTVFARVVETIDTSIGREAADVLRPAAEEIVRESIASIERGHLPRGVVFLLERFGVPEGVDLEPVLDAIRARYGEFADEVIPLPHPYDLHLQCLRIARLMERPRAPSPPQLVIRLRRVAGRTQYRIDDGAWQPFDSATLKAAVAKRAEREPGLKGVIHAGPHVLQPDVVRTIDAFMLAKVTDLRFEGDLPTPK
jgi:hypothetical protein